MNQNEAILLAKELELYLDGENKQKPFWVLNHEELTRFANLAAAREREACAVVCEQIDAEYEGEDVLATWCADAIRARGSHGTR